MSTVPLNGPGNQLLLGSRVQSDAETDHELTVGAYLHDWLRFMESRVRVVTLETYSSHLRVHVLPRLGDRPLLEIGPLDLQRLYSDLLQTCPSRGTSRLSARTVVHVHRVLSGAFRQAVRWRILAANPAEGASPPRPRRPTTSVVDVPMAELILSASRGTNLHVPVAIALGTGMRRGEILGLTWSDIDFDSRVLHVCRTLHITNTGLIVEDPKTQKSRRVIALPQFLLDILLVAHGDSLPIPVAIGGLPWDLVARTPSGKPWNPDTLSSSWRRHARRIGLPSVRFHDLRHAHATLMLVMGIHPKIVSERLGHSNIGITLDTYSHVLPSMQIQAAEALNELFGRTAG